ncbi:MAG: DUF4446 family protein [Nitriliruptorales bacterium]|nr:DUF4446 family protein [Nitriliruptorales bacterium]
MSIADSTADLLLVISLSVSGALLLVVAWLALRLHRLSKATKGALRDGENADVFEALAELRDGQGQLRDDLGVVHGNTEHLRGLLKGATSRLSIVRYDAFEDMGGGLSFSAAILNEKGSGIVLTAINGRQETRAYAKPVVEGDSEFSLSAEESTAIKQAMQGVLTTGAATDDPERRRRRRAS